MKARCRHGVLWYAYCPQCDEREIEFEFNPYAFPFWEKRYPEHAARYAYRAAQNILANRNQEDPLQTDEEFWA